MDAARGKMTTVAGEAHFLEEQMNPVRIKQYLDAARDYEKAKGMKWLLAMMSKGRDASEFFSDVVKNVVVKSVEVKKMVYMYLVHYADANAACRELALLSINSFQKDLAAPNQLIRAMALRVMTSIRVADIIQIQMLAVRKCASDSSPYVRKCAANAIPKIYHLDADQAETLHVLIEKLMRDSSTMVLGSAVTAFSEVCPDHWDLLHRSYRKLCHLLADVDEWAQIVILDTLARYVRCQFVDPQPGSQQAAKALAQQRSGAGCKTAPRRIKRRTVKKAFYSDEEDESQEEEVELPGDSGSSFAVGGFGSQQGIADAASHGTESEAHLDPDHRLALRSSLPLLKSRNSGVVLAVCSLHYYCGTGGVTSGASLGRALVRILRNQREIQFVVLKSIASMAQERPAMFRPFLNDFYVKGTDAGFNRDLKLEILTSLATADNTTPILRELQGYVRSADKAFVCSAVRAAGRVADARPDVADAVCAGLLALIAAHNKESKPSDALVVSTAVIVIRQLLQQGACFDEPAQPQIIAGEHASPKSPPVQRSNSLSRRDVVRRLARLLLARPANAEQEQQASLSAQPASPKSLSSALKGATARANVVWLLGEFHACVADVLPDAVRLLAQRFCEEETEVKQQIVNLAVKAALLPSCEVAALDSAREALQPLLRYVLELARFDLNHDLRDRARYFTALLGFAAQGRDAANAADEHALAQLRAHAERLVLCEKKAPVTLSGNAQLDGLPNLTVGSLSIMTGHQVDGYLELPEWPDLQPDPTCRDPATRTPDDPRDLTQGAPRPNRPANSTANDTSQKAFYANDEDNSDEDSDEDSDDDSDDDDDDSDDDDSDDSDDDDSDDDDDDEDDDDDDDDDDEEAETAAADSDSTDDDDDDDDDDDRQAEDDSDSEEDDDQDDEPAAAASSQPLDPFSVFDAGQTPPLMGADILGARAPSATDLQADILKMYDNH